MINWFTTRFIEFMLGIYALVILGAIGYVLYMAFSTIAIEGYVLVGIFITGIWLMGYQSLEWFR